MIVVEVNNAIKPRATMTRFNVIYLSVLTLGVHVGSLCNKSFWVDNVRLSYPLGISNCLFCNVTYKAAIVYMTCATTNVDAAISNEVMFCEVMENGMIDLICRVWVLDSRENFWI